MNDERSSPLGRFLKAARSNRHWTQTVLAEKSGVPQPTISDIERGITKLPGADFRRRLAKALDLRHVDILVAAGELAEDEIPIAGEPINPFPPNSAQAEAYETLKQLNADDARLAADWLQWKLGSSARMAAQARSRETAGAL